MKNIGSDCDKKLREASGFCVVLIPTRDTLRAVRLRVGAAASPASIKRVSVTRAGITGRRKGSRNVAAQPPLRRIKLTVVSNNIVTL